MCLKKWLRIQTRDIFSLLSSHWLLISVMAVLFLLEVHSNTFIWYHFGYIFEIARLPMMPSLRHHQKIEQILCFAPFFNCSVMSYICHLHMKLRALNLTNNSCLAKILLLCWLCRLDLLLLLLLMPVPFLSWHSCSCWYSFAVLLLLSALSSFLIPLSHHGGWLDGEFWYGWKVLFGLFLLFLALAG